MIERRINETDKHGKMYIAEYIYDGKLVAGMLKVKESIKKIKESKNDYAHKTLTDWHMFFTSIKGEGGFINPENNNFNELVGKNQYYILNPKENYSARRHSTGRGRIFVILFLHKEFVKKTIQEINYIYDDKEFKFNHGVYEKSPVLNKILYLLIHEMLFNKSAEERFAESSLKQLVIYLVKNHPCSGLTANLGCDVKQYKDERINNAVKCIIENFNKELSLNEIAKAACLSKIHFMRLFKKIVGTTPYNYLSNLRTKKAIEYMRQKRVKVVHASHLAGFRTDRQLYRNIKKYFKTTSKKIVK